MAALCMGQLSIHHHHLLERISLFPLSVLLSDYFFLRPLFLCMSKSEQGVAHALRKGRRSLFFPMDVVGVQGGPKLPCCYGSVGDMKMWLLGCISGFPFCLFCALPFFGFIFKPLCLPASIFLISWSFSVCMYELMHVFLYFILEIFLVCQSTFSISFFLFLFLSL